MWKVGRTVACALATAAVLAVAAPASAQTVWAVGDGGVTESTDDALGAYLATKEPFDRFLYLGDVYETGTLAEWQQNYDPAFGRFKAKSSPTPGNHEWGNRQSGYDVYWGDRAPRRPDGGHYYSFDVGDWHFVSLNSEEWIAADSTQIAWLKQDLAKYKGTCTIAYMHKPRYTATTGIADRASFEPVWDALEGHAVALLGGHDHNYERFHPVDGITQFIAGTGGRFRYQLNHADPQLAYGTDQVYGALRLQLARGSAQYAFFATDGTTPLDSGTLPCTPHDTPPTAAFNWSPQSPVAGEEVTFTSASSDPDGPLTATTWDLDDDGQYDDAEGTTAKRTFTSAGSHQVGVRVEDGQGDADTDVRTVEVGAAPPPPNQPPNAAFDFAPGAPVAGEEVTFTSTSTDPEGAISSIAWDLDDDGQYDDGQGASTKRTFTAAGPYDVGVRVEDDRGASDTAERRVTVAAAPTPAPAPTPSPPVPPPPAPGPPERQPPDEPRQPDFVPPTPPPLPSSVSVVSPRHGAVHSRRLRILRGDVAGASGTVSVTLLRRGRFCSRFNGGLFVRASCSTRIGVAAQTIGSQWVLSLPRSLRLPAGTYRLTARITGADGVNRLAGVTFRIR